MLFHEQFTSSEEACVSQSTLCSRSLASAIAVARAPFAAVSSPCCFSTAACSVTCKAQQQGNIEHRSLHVSHRLTHRVFYGLKGAVSYSWVHANGIDLGLVSIGMSRCGVWQKEMLTAEDKNWGCRSKAMMMLEGPEAHA